MSELIEFDPVDGAVAGALGSPGRRTFLIQAASAGELLTVVVEKEQVAALSSRLFELLGALEAAGALEEHPAASVDMELDEDADPLFRARLMRVGFDPARELILVELHEEDPAEETEEGLGGGFLVRLFLPPEQARLMAERGAEAVAAGRPVCRMCWLPINPEGHLCPALN